MRIHVRFGLLDRSKISQKVIERWKLVLFAILTDWSQIKILFAGFITGLSVFLIKFLTCERARRGLGLAPYSIFWNLVLAPPLATYVFPVSKSARSRTRVPPTGVYRFLTAPNGAFTPVVTYKILLIQSFLRSIWLKMSKICLFEALIKPLENV